MIVTKAELKVLTPHSHSVPENPFPRAVSSESNQPREVVTIQALNCISQSSFRIHCLARGQRVIDPGWPCFFLKCHQYRLLISGGPSKSLRNSPIEDQFMTLSIPVRPSLACARFNTIQRHAKHRDAALGKNHPCLPLKLRYGIDRRVRITEDSNPTTLRQPLKICLTQPEVCCILESQREIPRRNLQIGRVLKPILQPRKKGPSRFSVGAVEFFRKGEARCRRRNSTVRFLV